MSRHRLVTAALAAWFVLSTAPKAQPSSTVFQHVNVVSMTSDSVVRDTTVVISGSGIARVGTAPVPPGARQINGTGKYLMPALAEMHAHIPNDTAEAERVLFMYVANGIGTIRSMLGDPSHFRLRD